jgi:hypothetical protein
MSGQAADRMTHGTGREPTGRVQREHGSPGTQVPAT